MDANNLKRDQETIYNIIIIRYNYDNIDMIMIIKVIFKKIKDLYSFGFLFFTFIFIFSFY